MIRFHRLLDVSSVANQLRLAEVQRIYERAFPYSPEYARTIRAWIEQGVQPDLQVLLILAEGHKGRVHGFALTLFFPDLRYGYLDYLASEPGRGARGVGSALYEVTREALLGRKARGPGENMTRPGTARPRVWPAPARAK